MKPTLKEYIEQNPLNHSSDPMKQYDETIFNLYECLDEIGFQGQMGYKDRRLLKSWLSTTGESEELIKKLVRQALKHPHYSNQQLDNKQKNRSN